MARPLFALMAFAAGISSTAAAQATPDFSGRWMIVGAPVGSPASEPARPGTLGGVFEARQDEKTLTLVTGNDPDFRETTLPLNGDAVTTHLALDPEMRLRPDLGLAYVSTVSWQGARMVVTTNVGSPHLATATTARFTRVQSWSLNANGELVIETNHALHPRPTTSLATYRRFR